MELTYEQFLLNLGHVREAIATACVSARRASEEVSLLPVTKNHPASVVTYVARAGLAAVGENRVQDARDKRAAVVDALPNLRWELIGHLQTNKARLAAELFTRVQSVDSVRLLDHLDRAAANLGRKLSILLQVNAGRDPAKHGCELDEAPRLVEHALTRENLKLEGLMTIAPLDPEPAVAERTFVALRSCRDELAASFRIALPELSMGMTDDLDAAIRAGSTQVRIGTALFGQRMY